MFISFLSQILSAFLSLFAVRIYSEILTPLQLGQAMLALGCLALFDAIFSSSISQLVFYYGSKIEYQKRVYLFLDYYKRKYHLLGFLLILICFTLILTINSWFVVPFIIVAYIVIEPMRSSLFSFLNIVSNRANYGFQVVLDSFFTLLFSYSTLLISPKWYFLLLGILISRFCSIYTNNYFLNNSCKHFTEQDQLRRPICFEKRALLLHSKPIILMGVLGWITGFADRYILAATLNIIESGYYSIASSLVNRPYSIATSAFTAYFRPSLYTSISNRKIDKLKQIQFNWVLSACGLGLLGVFLFYFLSDFTVELLLSNKYKGNIEHLLSLLSIAMTFNIMSHVFENKFLAQGIGDKLFKLQILTIPLPLILISIGAIYFGIIGAILGRIISEFTRLLITFLYSKKFNL